MFPELVMLVSVITIVFCSYFLLWVCLKQQFLIKKSTLNLLLVIIVTSILNTRYSSNEYLLIGQIFIYALEIMTFVIVIKKKDRLYENEKKLTDFSIYFVLFVFYSFLMAFSSFIKVIGLFQ
jgi:hypothetical protein